MQKITKKRRKKPKKSQKFVSQLLSVVIMLMLLATAYSIINESNKDIEEISVSQLVTNINNGEISDIVVRGEKLEIVFKDGVEKISKKESESSLSDTLVNYGITTEQLNTINIDIKNQTGFGFWMLNILPFLLPILFLVFIIWMLSRQIKGAGAQAFTFGQSKARLTNPNDKKQRITFKDVAGVKEAKEELLEIVDFLKNPKKFIDIGAQIPKGVMLMGAPGTGKTLLARAVSGEANVPFFHISGSEFVELFVGIGASRVRDLFKLAKKSAPAIIFIDEIDAVGRARGTGVGGGNDEREQTLNQILVEMDGFEPNEKVIIIAATNRPDVLDPALLRPGRFDRRVVLDLPDRSDREEILKIHSKKKPFSEDVDLKVVAERTPGFSGADLHSLMNEGAILAAREERKKISQYDLIRSIEKVMIGPERKSHLLTKKEKKITAYHEAGHALVSSVLKNADPVHKVSIIARGNAGGYTLKLPLEERRLHTKKEFLDEISVSLGGYVTEKMVFNDLSTGPSSDLQVATAIARDMVTKYGMSDEIGAVAFERLGGKMLPTRAMETAEYSESIGAKIDKEVATIINTCLGKAEDVIIEHRKALDNIANELIEKESLEREEFEKLLILNGITPKKKEE